MTALTPKRGIIYSESACWRTSAS